MSKYYSSSIAFGAEQTKTEQVVVSPTKIGGVTTDAVSGALTVDEVPTLNSLNPVSSDGVARAVIQAGAELPTRGSSDTGKVLTVTNSDGDLEWDEPAEELPDMTGQDGKLLGAVDNNGTMEAQWVNPPDSYPSVAGNANKVLTVNSGATGVEWATPATPSVNEVPDVTSADNGKVLTASYSGGQGSYSWQTAQGGGGGGGASYSAGKGIAIDGNNAISVDASSSDFTFGQYSTLNKASNNYNFIASYFTNPSVICTKDSYIYLANETGNLHLVCDNSTFVTGNYAVCNTNYAFSNWQLTSDVKIALSKTASDWTFTGGTFNVDNGLWYLTIAGTTGSTVTPNGETPVNIEMSGLAQFNVISNPNQLSLKNPITVDQSYNASSTHAQSGTAVAQALANAGGITWTKISGRSITTTSSTLTANLSYSIPRGKTAVQVTIMLRLSNIAGSWSTIPKQLSVKLKLTDDYASNYYIVGSIIGADAWNSGSQPTIWMASGTVVVPSDWYLSIDGIQLELPMSTSSLPTSYDKDLFVGIA